MQVLTLSYLLKEKEICLALKKRGLGEGNWNGYGGKIESGETILAGAVREINEESEVVVQESDLEQIAIVDFHFKDGSHLEVHAFFTHVWEGEPQETEEMKPAWFPYAAIPYEKMWADDIHWLPRALKGEKLRGQVWFGDTNDVIEKMDWKEASGF